MQIRTDDGIHVTEPAVTRVATKILTVMREAFNLEGTVDLDRPDQADQGPPGDDAARDRGDHHHDGRQDDRGRPALSGPMTRVGRRPLGWHHGGASRGRPEIGRAEHGT